MHWTACTVNHGAWIRWVRGVSWVGGFRPSKMCQLRRRCQLSTDVWHLSDRAFVYSSIPFSSIRLFPIRLCVYSLFVYSSIPYSSIRLFPIRLFVYSLFVYASIPYSSMRLFPIRLCVHSFIRLSVPMHPILFFLHSLVTEAGTRRCQAAQIQCSSLLLTCRSRCCSGTLPPPPWLCVCYYVLLLALPLHSHATLVMHLR